MGGGAAVLSDAAPGTKWSADHDRTACRTHKVTEGAFQALQAWCTSNVQESVCLFIYSSSLLEPLTIKEARTIQGKLIVLLAANIV
jgi:hypothetical protein